MSFVANLASLVVNVVVNTQRVQANLQVVQNNLQQVVTRANQMQSAFANIRAAAAGLYIARTVINALDGAFRSVVETAAEVQQQFIYVQNAANFNPKNFELFKDSFTDLVKELKFAKFEDLQRVAVVASQAGVKGSANILKFTESVSKAAAVSESLDAENLARFFLLLGDKFKTGISETDHYANALTRLANEFRTNEAEIVKVATKITGTAQSFGLSVDQILAWSAAIRAAGINAERGSGAMLDFMNTMLGKGGQVGAAVGQDSNSFQQLIKEKPNEALLVFLEELQKYGSNATQTLINAGYESKRTKDTLLQLSNELVKTKQAMHAAGEGIQTTVDNERKLGVQINSINASLNRLHNNWLIFKNDIGEPIGAPILDFLSGSLENLTLGLKVSTMSLKEFEGYIFGQGLKQIKSSKSSKTNVNIDKEDREAEIPEAIRIKAAKADAKIARDLRHFEHDISDDKLQKKLLDIEDKFNDYEEHLREQSNWTQILSDKLQDLKERTKELAYEEAELAADEQRRKQMFEDEKNAEELQKKTEEASKSLGNLFATDKQSKILKIGEVFDNIISQFKAAGKDVPMGKLQQAFNQQMRAVKTPQFKIEGLDQAWANMQEHAMDKSNEIEQESLEALQKMVEQNDDEMQILRKGLPPVAVAG